MKFLKEISHKKVIIIAIAVVLTICIATSAALLLTKGIVKVNGENIDLSYLDSDSIVSSLPEKVFESESNSSSAPVIPVEETVVKPSTGSVLTAPEYKYEAKEDAPVNKSVNTDENSFVNSVTTNTVVIPGVSKIEATGVNVNVRTGPGTNYNSVGKISSGTQYNYLEQSTDSNNTVWYHINGNSVDGWIISDYSRTISSTSTADYYWKIENGIKYCIKDNVPLKGWNVVDGFMYYFDEATGAKKSYVGIDVSSHQGQINWQNVKAAGVDYAFIRVGYRGYETGRLCIDPKFEYNIKNAQAAGIRCGVYFYSVAVDEAESIQGANFVLNAISGYSLQMPVIIDEEHVGNRVAELSAEQRTNNAISFLETVKKAGYNVCLYTYFNYYNNYLEKSRVSNYTLWIAYYTTNSDRVSSVPYKYWQYTSSGSVNGIAGRVDMNIIFDEARRPEADIPKDEPDSSIPESSEPESSETESSQPPQSSSQGESTPSKDTSTQSSESDNTTT